MKKLVLTLDLHDNKDKQRALKKVSSFSGIDSISMDMNTKKLTVIGSVDPVEIVSKLRKLWHTEILSIGPAKEPEKKEEAKKEEAKKDEGKKDEPKKEEAKKDEEPKIEEKKPDPNQQLAELVNAYRAYNPMLSHQKKEGIELEY